MVSLSRLFDQVRNAFISQLKQILYMIAVTKTHTQTLPARTTDLNSILKKNEGNFKRTR